MTPSTVQIAEDVQSYVASLYDQLFGAMPLVIAGLIVFAIGAVTLTLAAAKKLNARNSLPHVTWPYVAMAGAVAACVFAVLDSANHGGIVGVVLLFLAAAAAIFGLIKKTAWAKYVVVGIIWLYLAPYEINCVAAALRDYAAIDSFAPISQLGVYAVGNYIVYHAIAAALLATVLSCAALFFLRRYWKFGADPDADAEEFDPSTLSPGDAFVPCAVVLAVVLLLPAFAYGDLSDVLVSGTAGISNAYVERLNAYLDDNSVREDAGWMEGFTAASYELYQANGRFLDINFDAVRQSDLQLYIRYSEASFRQMEAIELAYEEVSAGEPIDDAVAVFNDSIDAQQNALIGKLNSIAIGDTLNEAPRMAYDGVRLYMRLLGLVPFGCVLIVVGILCGVAGVVLNRFKPKRKVAAGLAEGEPPEDSVLSKQIEDELTKATEGFMDKPAFRAALIVGIIVATIASFVLMEVIPAMEGVQEQENAADFITEIQATLALRPVELALWLQEAEDADEGNLTPEYLQEGIDLIDAQLAGLDALSTWDDLPEGSEEFGALAAQRADDEKPILEEMRGVLEGGEIPSQDLVSEYSQLHYGEDAEKLETSLEAFLIEYSMSNALGLLED